MYTVEAQVKRANEDEPDEWRSGTGLDGGAEGPGKGVAPSASLNGMRRSEKAKVLEKT
jgi:hypothetical protein